MAIDSDGLFGKANEAAHKWNSAVGEEENTINNLFDILDEVSPTLKPMITKWNISSGDEVWIGLNYPYSEVYDTDDNFIHESFI